MNNNSLYDKFIDSKTGITIPVFTSGRTVESRYDPVRECERLALQIKQNTNFVIVLGIAGGTLINCIQQIRPEIFILAVEKNEADINFLLQLDKIKDMQNQKNICLCTFQNLKNKITELYLPSLYGNLEVIEQKGWTTENQDILSEINKSISIALHIVSADFSVQSHFGRLWQHNILSNLFFCNNQKVLNKLRISNNKTAVVFAAGPSLDDSIQQIINKRQNYYLIATDTAFSLLVNYNLMPDAVISIDGQFVSNTHFIHSKKSDFSTTTFIFDLSANCSAVKKLAKQNANLLFFKSGHPFCEYADSRLGLELPSLFSGAGTVTICAVDFAIKSGFKQILVLGADFAYINGKPYAKGTYLDKLYNSSAFRLESSQKKFCSLEFRTELEKINNISFTTDVLKSYRQSFEEYLYNNNATVEKTDQVYSISNLKGQNMFLPAIQNQKYCSPSSPPSASEIISLIKEVISKKDISLLPLISWIRTHDNNNKADFDYYFNKAVQYFGKWLKM